MEGKYASAVLNNFYVDDGLLVTDFEESGIRLANQLRQLLQCHGFNLTKWIRNSCHIIESVPAESHAKGVQNLDVQQTCQLNVPWGLNGTQRRKF